MNHTAESNYRPIAERIRDYREVERPRTKEELAPEARRCMNCGIPFCHGNGCPLGNVIPDMNAAFLAGDLKKAWQILSMTSFFPEFTSRVCPALCEGSCTHGIDESPVAVRQIEKFVIENAFARNWVQPFFPETRRAETVAVVGSGPAGLYAAEALNRRGYSVTVFESARHPGGLLRYGIPDFKLEKSILDRRIELMRAAGIQFVTNTTVGQDISAAYLQKNYHAVLFAVGTPAARELNVPHRSLDGIHQALDFLRGQNRFLAGEISTTPISAEGKNVVVIGGGDTGSDCAGTAIRQHAKSVTQIEIMPRPPETRSASTPWPAWPWLLRTSSSQMEGCTRRWNVATDSFVGHAGHVTDILTHAVRWSCSPEGKPLQFEAVPNSSKRIKADLVLLAMGFLGVPDDFSPASQLGLTLSPRSALLADPARRIFACGDCANGASLVVRAMADAKRTVEQMDALLR